MRRSPRPSASIQGKFAQRQPREVNLLVHDVAGATAGFSGRPYRAPLGQLCTPGGPGLTLKHFLGSATGNLRMEID